MTETICIPIDLDAFVLNEAVCDGGKTRIAPITKPDYVSLRLENSVIQHDILPRHDLHNTDKASTNPRISTTFSQPFQGLDTKNPSPPTTQLVKVRESRLGVYLHWSLPRGYRAGTSAAQGTDSTNNNAKATSNPTFRPVPNRWLVVRVLKPGKFQPTPPDMPLICGWVVESDRLLSIDALDGSVDLETDISPFVNYDENDPNNVLQSQAEKYIGFNTSVTGTSSWTETNQPRVNGLTTMSSSNPLFADYTAHNANVFSMKDNFQCGPGQYLRQATCDYFVVGWHSNAADGPLGSNGIKGTLDSRLRTFLCSLDNNQKLKNLDEVAATKLKNTLDSFTVLCHGAIYGVVYDRDAMPKTLKPSSDDYVDNFTQDVKMEPVAVGVSPLDAVLTFLHAHEKDDAQQERILGQGTEATANKILDLSELLYAADDDYSSRIKAADLLSSQHFKGSGGGFEWHFDKKKPANGPPQAPSTKPDANNKSELDYLNELNGLQQNLDMVERSISTQRWDLFANFFNYCSDPHQTQNAANFAQRVSTLYSIDRNTGNRSGTLVNLLKTKTALENAIAAIISPQGTSKQPLIPVRKVAAEAFFKRSDPTLMIAGVDAGWPAYYLKRMDVRFGSEIQSQSSDDLGGIVSRINPSSSAGAITTTILSLLKEANQTPQSDRPGFKTWAGQPFRPIFVEWEGVFYNIDWPNWEVDLKSSPLSSNNAPQVRYVNNRAVNGMHEDARSVSGRILVLPQPNFAMKAMINQVFGSTPTTDLPPAMKNWTDDDKQKFADQVDQLKFISGELDGFTDALLTLTSGTHVKPNVRKPGQSVIPLQEAVDKGMEIGLSREHFTVIDSESAKTPYGNIEDFVGVKHQPFKGVQHGQLALTNIKIIDKFGQAVCCPLPKPRPRPAPVPTDPDFPVHPCLTDRLCPSVLSDKTLNTVYKSTDPVTSSGGRTGPFIQITPAINQGARINASFVELELDRSKKETGAWKQCTEWENPIFGWIIVNYADSCLQFFTGSGLFFTSLHFGGQAGTASSLKWAPFASPPTDEVHSLVSPQLVNLIKKMQGGSTEAQAYLAALWDMIESAIHTMPFPPSQYSGYANAIVGKPLALVNIGWSLELATPPLRAQHLIGPQPGDSHAGFENPTVEDMMLKYGFPVKIGDWTRPFDGLVCYWNNDPQDKAGSTSFDTMHTYFPQEKAEAPRQSILPSNYPTLTPHWFDPTQFNGAPGLAREKVKNLMVKTCLIDPYTPIHLYTGILPIKSIQLPGWTLQIAMKNMTAFFTVGPILVSTNLPRTYDTSKPLTASSWIDDQANPTSSTEEPKIKLPISGGKGMWNWLQPFVDTTSSNTITNGEAEPPRPLYNAFEVGKDDGRLRNDTGPYTLLEGFLQLARPLLNDSNS